MENQEEYEKILKEVSELSNIEKGELSIFDIGGKGYYENPASDILGFYLSSRCPIYKSILETFLKFCKDNLYIENEVTFDIENEVTFEREVYTNVGNRIDIIIKGKDWVITIENKIRHWLANDLNDYENYVNSHYNSQMKYFFVLSNDENNLENSGWQHIKWSNLLDKFDETINYNLSSDNSKNIKWWYFFKDFTLCLNNEFNGGSSMDKKTRDFFHNNYKTINDLINMRNKYLNDNLMIIQDKFGDYAEIKAESNKTVYRLTLKKQTDNNRRIDVLILLNYGGEWSFNFYFWKNEIKPKKSNEETSEENKNIKEVIPENRKDCFLKKYEIKPEESWEEKDYLGPIWCFRYRKEDYNTLEEICIDVDNLIKKINEFFN